MTRFKRARGWKLFRWKQRQIEIWFIPADEAIPPHVHNHIDSTLLILGGGCLGGIGERIGAVGWRDMFRRFEIPKGVTHWAKANWPFFLFLNCERWDGVVSSASNDFTPRPNTLHSPQS